MEKYIWNVVPEDKKEQLPAEFKNISFRLLFEKALSVGAEVVKHFECGTNIRAVIIDLVRLLDAPRYCEDGVTVSDLQRLLLINNIDRAVYRAVIISTVEKEAMKALLENELPTYFAGVIDNTTCRPAFLQAAEELSLNVQEVENALCFVDDRGRQIEYKLYFVKSFIPAQILGNNQSANPTS